MPGQLTAVRLHLSQQRNSLAVGLIRRTLRGGSDDHGA